MFLFVGLGNPGQRYAQTRHNAGFFALDAVGSIHHFSPEHQRWNGITTKGRIGEHHIITLKPNTFMNCSIDPVHKALMWLKIPLDRMIVFHDDVDLPLGVVRFKKGGTDGGHNGLRSISERLGAKYYRVRIGISAPERYPSGKRPISDYVLSPMTSEEKQTLTTLLPKVAQKIDLFLSGEKNAWMRTLANLSSSSLSSPPQEV